MSRAELLMEIEQLRAELNGLATVRADYGKMLEVSQMLDILIVEFQAQRESIIKQSTLNVE